ncbi:MAG: hypothetical protein B6D41_03330 [Chloroflexi bacterium UTCFX4]|jgi:uncharacterized protein (DUF608 family)|nr:MAG: hypothetical protein B6D41_03330 [Chloroflexi bacterium UTCFX4]
MANKTDEVLQLVEAVLKTIPKPYGEDIIEDVFLAIEKRQMWLGRYERLVRDLSKDSVNQWIGQYTKQLTNMDTVMEVDAKRSRLIVSYSKLCSKQKK